MFKWAAGLTILFATTICANAELTISDRQTSQPIGHYDFCHRLPTECQPTKVAKIIHYTGRVRNALYLLNYSINNTYGQEDDQIVYGKEEWWTFPDKRRIGDCEDFVLEKRRELHSDGYAYSNLLIAVVFRSNGEGHAVLIVRTDAGNFVLDNLTDAIEDWNSVPYKFQKIVAPYNSGKWLAIDSTSNLVAGSK